MSLDMKSALLKTLMPSVKPYIPMALSHVENVLKEHLGKELPDGISRRTVLLTLGKDGELYVMDALLDAGNKVVYTENAKNAPKWANDIINKMM